MRNGDVHDFAGAGGANLSGGFAKGTPRKASTWDAIDVPIKTPAEIVTEGSDSLDFVLDDAYAVCPKASRISRDCGRIACIERKGNIFKKGDTVREQKFITIVLFDQCRCDCILKLFYNQRRCFNLGLRP